MKPLLALAFVATGAVAQQAPLSFKGLQIGGQLAASPLAVRLECREGLCTYFGQGKSNKETIGGADIDRLIVKLDGTGAIAFIDIAFPSDAFESVRDGLLEKYALTCKKSLVQNRRGASAAQERCSFTNDAGAIDVSRHEERIGSAGLSIYSRAVAEENQRRSTNSKKDL